MGLSFHGTRSLLYAKTQGVSFTRTAMIGRQELHLSAAELKKNLSEFGYLPAANQVDHLMSKEGGFAEPLLEVLGATEVCSFDASAFEGASHVHDFNTPIDATFSNRFSAVIDAGTLEHIFNFPVAIKSCMEMVEVGGHFIGITPANNWTGHGFYQFSPDLFFRIFSQPNGFSIVRMIMFENRPRADWFEVADPGAIKERVSLINTEPTFLLVLAKKVASVQIFAAPPQQSDYVALWQANDTKEESGTIPVNGPRFRRGVLSRMARWLYGFAPAPVKTFYRRIAFLRPGQSFSNRRFFRRLQIPERPR